MVSVLHEKQQLMQSIFMKYQYVYEVGGHTVEDRKQIWTSRMWINHQSTWSVSVVINQKVCVY